MTDRALELFDKAKEILRDENPSDRNLTEVKRIAQELHAMRFSGAFEIEALAALREGDPESAERHLEKGLEAAPGVWLLWQLLGNVRSDLGRLDEADAAYEKALGCDGAFTPSIVLNRAVLDMRRGRLHEARHALERLRDEVDDDEIREHVESTWLDCRRCIRNEELTSGKIFEVLLDGPLAADELPEDPDDGIDRTKPHRFVVTAHVAARDAKDVARIVREELADELPHTTIDEVSELQDGAGFLAGVYWLSGRAIYPVDTDD